MMHVHLFFMCEYILHHHHLPHDHQDHHSPHHHPPSSWVLRHLIIHMMSWKAISIIRQTFLSWLFNSASWVASGGSWWSSSSVTLIKSISFDSELMLRNIIKIMIITLLNEIIQDDDHPILHPLLLFLFPTLIVLKTRAADWIILLLPEISSFSPLLSSNSPFPLFPRIYCISSSPPLFSSFPLVSWLQYYYY